MQKNKKNSSIFYLILSFFLLFSFINIYHSSSYTNNQILYKIEEGNKQIDLQVYAEEVYKVPESKDESESNASNYTDVIKNIEGGSTFEEIIAILIASCIGALMSLISKVGDVKSLDTLIFNAGSYVDGFTPLSQTDWGNIKQWYVFMIAAAASIFLIAVLVIFLKFIKASGNIQYRQKAIDSLKRLGASTIIIGITPIIIHLLLYINNNIVYMFYTTVAGGKGGSLQSALGGASVLEELSKGLSSPLAGALILGLFAYIQIKLTIMFIIRDFNIIVYTIFTPFVAVLWIIDENINGAKVWLGELLSNIFMQMSYAFLFAIYLSFIGDKNWLVQLIWGNLIIVLGDVIRNMLQGKLTNLSGMSESQMSGNMITAGTIATVSGMAGISSLANSFKAISPKPNDSFENKQGNSNSSITDNVPYSSSNNIYLQSNQQPNSEDTIPLENNTSSQTTLEKPSFVDRSIKTGNKIGRVGGALAKGVVTMGAMPIAMASSDRHLMKSVRKVGESIDDIALPIGRVIGTGVTATSIVKDKVKNTKTYNNVAETVSNAVPESVKEVAKGSTNTIDNLKNITTTGIGAVSQIISGTPNEEHNNTNNDGIPLSKREQDNTTNSIDDIVKFR